MLVYNEKYIKAKVREFNGVSKTNFLRDEIPREGVHYAFMAFITINSIMRMKKKIIHKFIWKNVNTKYTELEPESEWESDTELESKSELESDSE